MVCFNILLLYLQLIYTREHSCAFQRLSEWTFVLHVSAIRRLLMWDMSVQFVCQYSARTRRSVQPVGQNSVELCLIWIPCRIKASSNLQTVNRQPAFLFSLFLHRTDHAPCLSARIQNSKGNRDFTKGNKRHSLDSNYSVEEKDFRANTLHFGTWLLQEQSENFQIYTWLLCFQIFKKKKKELESILLMKISWHGLPPTAWMRNARAHL